MAIFNSYVKLPEGTSKLWMVDVISSHYTHTDPIRLDLGHDLVEDSPHVFSLRGNGRTVFGPFVLVLDHKNCRDFWWGKISLVDQDQLEKTSLSINSWAN